VRLTTAAVVEESGPMSDPSLQPTSMPIVLGQPYTISSLFTYVPGTGPDGEPVVGVRVGFGPAPNESFSTPPDPYGSYDFTITGDVSGVTNTEPSWSGHGDFHWPSQ
jgi:hypothetical protein